MYWKSCCLEGEIQKSQKSKAHYTLLILIMLIENINNIDFDPTRLSVSHLLMIQNVTYRTTAFFKKYLLGLEMHILKNLSFGTFYCIMQKCITLYIYPDIIKILTI